MRRKSYIIVIIVIAINIDIVARLFIKDLSKSRLTRNENGYVGSRRSLNAPLEANFLASRYH